MNSFIARTLTCTMVAITGTAGLLFSISPVSAAAPSVVTKAPTKLVASVTVPKDGQPVTYTLKGKIITIKPGETAQIPVGAKNLKLPLGTIFTLASLPTKKGGLVSSNSYTLSEPVSLQWISSKSITAKSTAFVLASQTGPVKFPTGPITELMDTTDASSSIFDFIISDGN